MPPALRTLAATAAFGLAAAALPLQAAPASPAQVSVKYADLDLDTQEGRAALEKRIQAAARKACGMDGTLTTGSRMPSYSMRTCYAKATSDIGESVARAVEKQDDKG